LALTPGAAGLQPAAGFRALRASAFICAICGQRLARVELPTARGLMRIQYTIFRQTRSHDVIPLAHRTHSLIELDPRIHAPAALPDRLYAVLKHRILTCAMRPGERITEKDVCTEMSVSRTPLREALNRLALEGLVVLTPYRGYVVAPVTVRSFQELCEVRRVLEPGAAALAARRATPEMLKALRAEAGLTYTPGQPDTYEAYLRANSRFHQTLVRCTGNSLLETMVASALDRHQRPLYMGLDVGIDAAAVSAEHRQLVDALERHDAKRARSLMKDHVSRAEARIVGALRAAGYR